MHSSKDNLINDFYDDWSIEKTCDTVTLESSHPFKAPTDSSTDLWTDSWTLLGGNSQMFYTHECKDDEIAYFKVDVNLIGRVPDAYLGNV